MIDKLAYLPFIFVGGGIGASLRWSVSLVTLELGAPLWGATLFVNGLGTLLYFLSIRFGLNDLTWHQHFLRVGILGSLTTFSTFSYEVFSAAKSGQTMQAAVIFGLNILTGIIIAVGMLR
jgi:CrcB protein